MSEVLVVVNTSLPKVLRELVFSVGTPIMTKFVIELRTCFCAFTIMGTGRYTVTFYNADVIIER